MREGRVDLFLRLNPLSAILRCATRRISSRGCESLSGKCADMPGSSLEFMEVTTWIKRR